MKNFIKQNWFKGIIGILVLFAYIYLLFYINSATQKILRVEAESQCHNDLMERVEFGTLEGGRLSYFLQCVEDKMIEWNK